MEQARYWIWPTPKHGQSARLQATATAKRTPVCGDSWEEQAFAEDTAGLLGGCVWPPRSYSCSFCGREFRSAQALGGHMNVHRRDRARLKQSPNPNNEIIDHHQDHHGNIMNHHHHHHHHHLPSTPLDVQYQASQIVNMVYSPNPDFVFTSPSLQSRVSTLEKTSCVPFFSSSILDQHPNKKSSILAPPSWSNLVAERYLHVPDPKLPVNNPKTRLGLKNMEGENHAIEDNLNLALQQTNCKEEGDLTCKRRKIDPTPLLSFLKENSSEGDHLQSEILEGSSSSSEEIDLELRLGDRPEVK